jgi:hypothetical protein
MEGDHMPKIESKLLRALKRLLKLPQNHDSTDPKTWPAIHRAQRTTADLQQIKRGSKLKGAALLASSVLRQVASP